MDKSVDIVDLCKTIFSKWKLILSMGLIFLLLFLIYGIYTSNKLDKSSNESIKILESSISDDDKELIKDAANTINSYKKIYDEQKNYNENSIYQRLDPFSIKTVELVYYVDNYHKILYPAISETDNLSAIVQYYSSVVCRDELYGKMSQEIDSSVSPTYYQELVSVDTVDKGNGVFSVSINALTDDDLEKMSNIIKEELGNNIECAISMFGEHGFLLVSEERYELVDFELANYQQQNLKKMTELIKNIEETKSAFSGQERDYLSALNNEQVIEKVSVVKYCIIGVACAIVFSVVGIIISYILSNTIKTEKDLETVFNMNYLGTNANIVATKINLLAKDKKVGLVIDKNVTGADDWLNQVKNEIGKNVIVINDVLFSESSLNDLANVNCAVLIVSLKKSKLKDVGEEIDLCEMYTDEIVGVATV